MSGAVIDHKDNPPTAWHNLAVLSLVNPCIISLGDVQLKKGQPLVLRYPLVAHDGPVPVDLIEKLSEEFGGDKPEMGGLEEDPKLVMWYDQAVTQSGGE